MNEARFNANKKILDCSAIIQGQLGCLSGAMVVRQEAFPNDSLEVLENVGDMLADFSASLAPVIAQFGAFAELTTEGGD